MENDFTFSGKSNQSTALWNPGVGDFKPCNYKSKDRKKEYWNIKKKDGDNFHVRYIWEVIEL